MRTLLKTIGCLLLALVLLLGAALGVLTLLEYRPADTETVLADHETEAVFALNTPLTVVTWNCGYGALGDNADFFMDGGASVVTADEGRVRQNLQGIRDALQGMGADLILLQEVDIQSDRSHRVDEREVLSGAMEAASELFAYNFNSFYVPYPLPPIGHVESGLYTLSAAPVREAVRVSLPCPFSWPLRIANLKRCLLVSRIPLQGTDRELVLINLHLEAYDSGEGKIAQTRQLVSLLEAEAEKGNYVIAGGDFNQRFSNVDSSAYPVYQGMWQPGLIDANDFGGEFSLLMDASSPTCRSLDRPLAGASREGFQFYMIDGYIVSSNVRVEAVETVDLDFVCSDHNPVRMTFSLAD